MPNYRGNPNIASYGKGTRFGTLDAADPSIAGSASKLPFHSIRAELRYISGQDICCDPKNFDQELVRLAKMGNGKTTVARLLAVCMFRNAIKYACPRMFNIIINIVDGKLK